jgi:hypothetical protein
MAKSVKARIRVGSRVRVKGQQIGEWRGGLMLRDSRGTVIRPDEDVDLGYYVVKLDVPALAETQLSGEWRELDKQPDGTVEPGEIVWLDDNLELLES